MKKFLDALIIILLLVVFLISGYKIVTILYEYTQSNKLYDELRKQKEATDKNFVDLSDINEDFICWINIENTNIDYPVVQSGDNLYYLHRDIYGKYLYAGTLFMDYKCDYDISKNLIIYGHNMKNKTMFSRLEKFKEEEFFYSNPKITITDKQKTSEYEVFAVMVVPKDFDYIVCDFKNEDDYQKYLNKIINQSIYKSKNNPTNKNKIITLSTCSYEFDEARTVVFAKKIK